MTSQPLFRRSLLSQDKFVWLIAIVLSLSVHLIVFLQRHNKLNAAPATVIQETVTHVRFSTLAPPPVTVVEPEVVAPKPEPVVPPEPVLVQEQIVQEPKPAPLVKPKPRPKPKVKKKTPVKPKPKVQQPVKPKPPKKERKPVRQQQTVAQNIKPETKKTVKASPIVAQADPLLVEQTRMSYHALLMRHIEVHKRYPRVARKRKIEGKILVSFTLLKNGSIKNLLINGKKSILKKASRQAVEDALPMPHPPEDLSLPMEVKFTMNYFLK